jgi:type IV fimbrial biogenesis protein FimT
MRYRCRGFTLFELFVTLAVAGILVAVATPSLTVFVQNNRETSEGNSLVMSLDYARSEAIKEDATIQICASSDGQTCNVAAGAGAWASGWIVTTTTAAPTVLQVMSQLGANNTLSASFDSGAGPANISQVTFQPDGFVQAAAGSNVYNITYFTLCDERGATFARDVEISPIGSVQSSSTAGQTLAGAALTCP